MAGLKDFVVVHFLESNTVEAVPSNWLRKHNADLKCFFPPKVFEVTKLVNSRSEPSTTWGIFPVRKWKGSFADVKEARQVANKAEKDSDYSSAEQTVDRHPQPLPVPPPLQPTSLLIKNFPHVSNPPNRGNKSVPSSSSTSEPTPTTTRGRTSFNIIGKNKRLKRGQSSSPSGDENSSPLQNLQNGRIKNRNEDDSQALSKSAPKNSSLFSQFNNPGSRYEMEMEDEGEENNTWTNGIDHSEPILDLEDDDGKENSSPASIFSSRSTTQHKESQILKSAVGQHLTGENSRLYDVFPGPAPKNPQKNGSMGTNFVNLVSNRPGDSLNAQFSTPQSTTLAVESDELKYIVKILNRIEIRLKNHEQNSLAEIQALRGLIMDGSNSIAEEVEESAFLLPLKTVAEVEEAEKSLADNPKLKKWLSRKFISTGSGNEISEAARKCIRKLFSMPLECEYSLRGMGKKKNFSALTLYEILKDALKGSMKNFKEEAFDLAIGNELKWAPEKLRKLKMKNSVPNGNEENSEGASQNENNDNQNGSGFDDEEEDDLNGLQNYNGNYSD